MGAIAKIFSSTITYPLAVIKSRLYQRKPESKILVKTIAKTLITPVPGTTVVELPILATDIGMNIQSQNPSKSTSSSSNTSISSNSSSSHRHHIPDNKYANSFDVIRTVAKLEGWKGFYKGNCHIDILIY
jgi:hypothetical protein